MFVVVALLPLLVALTLLLVFQWSPRDAGWTTLGGTITIVSLFPAFHLTSWQAFLSLEKGATTLFSLAIVMIPALLFYRMQQETGAIDILMRGIAKLVPDRDLQTLLLRIPP